MTKNNYKVTQEAIEEVMGIVQRILQKGKGIALDNNHLEIKTPFRLLEEEVMETEVLAKEYLNSLSEKEKDNNYFISTLDMVRNKVFDLGKDYEGMEDILRIRTAKEDIIRKRLENVERLTDSYISLRKEDKDNNFFAIFKSVYMNGGVKIPKPLGEMMDDYLEKLDSITSGMDVNDDNFKTIVSNIIFNRYLDDLL